MTRVIVDPVTRIEGHLRIEAVVENGVITDAFSAGTMVRGLEKILMGRDPRDAWAITERVCGVCTHGSCSDQRGAPWRMPLGITVPPTAELIRNIMMTTQYMHDHVIHFYQPARAGLGGHCERAEGRPEEGGGTGAIVLQMGQKHAGIFLRRSREDQELCRQWVGHFCQRVLGASGLQIAAGSEPDCGSALSGTP